MRGRCRVRHRRVALTAITCGRTASDPSSSSQFSGQISSRETMLMIDFILVSARLLTSESLRPHKFKLPFVTPKPIEVAKRQLTSQPRRQYIYDYGTQDTIRLGKTN